MEGRRDGRAFRAETGISSSYQFACRKGLVEQRIGPGVELLEDTHFVLQVTGADGGGRGEDDQARTRAVRGGAHLAWPWSWQRRGPDIRAGERSAA